MMKKRFGLLLVLLFVVSSCGKKSATWEMVIHAQKATVSSNQLTLTDVSQVVTLFTKQTPRKVESAHLEHIVENWNKMFATSSPNAVLTMTDSSGQVTDHVIILQKPTLVNNTLQFEIKDLANEGQNARTGRNATVYIDNASMIDGKCYIDGLQMIPSAPGCSGN